MKYFVTLVIIVTLVHATDEYVLKTRPDVTFAFRGCLSTLRVSKETFQSTKWNLRGDNDLVRSMIKCVIIDFGLFDETTGFNKEDLVKQFGGETVRERVLNCVDENIDGDATNKWVERVMNCLEDDHLTLYTE